MIVRLTVSSLSIAWTMSRQCDGSISETSTYWAAATS